MHTIFRVHVLIAVLGVGLGTFVATPAESRDGVERWQGHDWVFVFSADDGLKHSVGWGAVADSLDFNFTINVNQFVSMIPNDNVCYKLTPAEIQDLAGRGNEISQHGYAHGTWGLVESDECFGPSGGLTNYWDTGCYAEGISSLEAFENFMVEVSRDSMVDWIGIDPVTLAYPFHLHSDSTMYHLERLGYLGARSGFGYWNSPNFTVYPLNSWEGGMSLYRLPLMTSTITLWGDHWDQDGAVPQHFSGEMFRAKFDSVLVANNVIEDGKMFCLYTHDFGADDDRYCDRNWNRGGLTPEELAETVTYARERGAIVMTFGEAVAWYRQHAVRVDDPVAEYGEEYAGDIVWRADPSIDVPSVQAQLSLEQNFPNPFNPRTDIGFTVLRAGPATIAVYDLAGRLVRVLVDGELSAGRHVVSWNGSDDGGRAMPSGVYYYSLTGDITRQTMKMTLIR